MELFEIARAFDMTVLQFAKHIGYSPQSLYGLRLKNKVRAKAAATNLRALSEAMCTQEIELAERRFEARERAVKELEKMAGVEHHEDT